MARIQTQSNHFKTHSMKNVDKTISYFKSREDIKDLSFEVIENNKPGSFKYELFVYFNWK